MNQDSHVFSSIIYAYLGIILLPEVSALANWQNVILVKSKVICRF